MAAVGDLRALIRKSSKKRHVTEDACQASQEKDLSRLAAGEDKYGFERMGQTAASALSACVSGCLLYDDSDPGDVVGLQMVAQDCGHAAVVLDDLERAIKDSQGPWAP